MDKWWIYLDPVSFCKISLRLRNLKIIYYEYFIEEAQNIHNLKQLNEIFMLTTIDEHY